MMRIGVSACFFHADPQRAIFKGKTLLYLVQDVGQWLLTQGVMPVLIPTLPEKSGISLQDMVGELDGLVLQGGSDVAPESYGERALKPEWTGDRKRDIYEISLVEEFVRAHKPVLGLCRGLQLLNVALKGTLYQDIPSQIPDALNHRNWDIYEQNFHQIDLAAGSALAKLYPGVKTATVNSVHHQAVKDLGQGLSVQALSVPDRVVEAVRLNGDNYVVGVQWHPEFQNPQDPKLLSTIPLLEEFLAAAETRSSMHA